MYIGRRDTTELYLDTQTMNGNMNKPVTTTTNTTKAPPRKRESRAGTRKVTSLTAEQLYRKRANDREAQRTIRQRTKELIESLSKEVFILKAKNEQFDHVVRQNISLQGEVRQLREQLAVALSSSNPPLSGNGKSTPL